MRIVPANSQEQLKQELLRFSLTENTMAAFVYSCVRSNDAARSSDQTYVDTLAGVGAAVLSESGDIPKHQLRQLIHELNEALNLNIATDSLDPEWKIKIRALRSFSSAAIFVFVSYLVLGGIWSGDSGLSDEFSRAAIYLFLFCFIVLLAALEGTQLSVTLLKLKDLDSLKDQYPRSYSLHKRFKTDEGTKTYLAGRQLLVIVIVFCIAQLTSFPDITHWPLTDRALPGYFFPWIHLIFFKLGILGAIFVLWFGQLVPQFLAATNPQKFLNWPGMGLVLNAAWWSESLGLTQPVDWLTKGAQLGDVIPPSNKELFYETSQNLGYSVLSLSKRVTVNENDALCSTETVIQVLSSHNDLIVDDAVSFELAALVPGSIKLICTLTRGAESIDIADDLLQTEERFDSHSGVTTRVVVVRPAEGNFISGDVIRLETIHRLSFCHSIDISITSPTRYAYFSIEFDGRPVSIQSPRRIIHEWDATRNGFYQYGEEVELRKRQDNEVMQFEHSLLFPKPFTKHYYSWEWDFLEK